MSKTYTPGSEADAIIAQQVACGHFSTLDEVVRAAVQLLD
jgi:Arc/MetJ-type ribon-helix-helix transcriptional regulator